MTDFEKFIHDRGWEFKTEEALRAAYDRRWKAAHDIALTEDEFIAEAKGDHPTNYDTDTLKEVYASLTELVTSRARACPPASTTRPTLSERKRF